MRVEFDVAGAACMHVGRQGAALCSITMNGVMQRGKTMQAQKANSVERGSV